jgi:AraC-like DNA-binding protein
MRQEDILLEYDPAPGFSISSLEYDYAAGFEVPSHAHGAAQLIYAIRGVMQVSSDGSMWVIPPQFALWLPAGTHHSIQMPRAVSMRTLYLRPRLVTGMPQCTVLHVSPLLRELIIETVRLKQLRRRRRDECAVIELIVRELQRAQPVPTFIRLPSDKRALAVARVIVEQPGQSKPLAALCAQAGVSVRTIERLFHGELGCGFSEWRRQVRLTRGIEMLAAGDSVKEVAYSVGYSQPSAFVQAFRLTFGDTPKAWITRIQSR